MSFYQIMELAGLLSVHLELDDFLEQKGDNE